jgi:DNA-binding response OmpR family regulator
MRVLLVEDHDRLAWALAAGLRRHAMDVEVALNGDDALDRLRACPFDVVVLDRDLPGTHGDDVCRTLVAERNTCRILMLTASGAVHDLVARIRALARRAATTASDQLGYGDLTLDAVRHLATRAGRDLALSPKEFAVLECVLGAEGRPVSADELLERVWGIEGTSHTTTVKATVNRLRAKLGEPPVIDTVRDWGYRIGGR